jgi:hypothetical protein
MASSLVGGTLYRCGPCTKLHRTSSKTTSFEHLDDVAKHTNVSLQKALHGSRISKSDLKIARLSIDLSIPKHALDWHPPHDVLSKTRQRLRSSRYTLMFWQNLSSHPLPAKPILQVLASLSTFHSDVHA